MCVISYLKRKYSNRHEGHLENFRNKIPKDFTLMLKFDTLYVAEYELRKPYCVVPENIQTPTMEGIGNSGGWGGQRPRKIQKGGGLDHKITFQGVNIISFSTRVRTLLLTDLVDRF